MLHSVLYTVLCTVLCTLLCTVCCIPSFVCIRSYWAWCKIILCTINGISRNQSFNIQTHSTVTEMIPIHPTPCPRHGCRVSIHSNATSKAGGGGGGVNEDFARRRLVKQVGCQEWNICSFCTWVLDKRPFACPPITHIPGVQPIEISKVQNDRLHAAPPPLQARCSSASVDSF